MKQLAILKDKGKGNHGGTNPIVKENILLLTEKRLSKYTNDVPFLTKLDVPQTVEQLTIASAIETLPLTYYASAENFPVGTKFYPATPKTVTLAVGDATFGRVDLILANKPDVVGGMGYITVSKGTPSANYTPNNIDLSTQYIIKWIYVAPNATVGVDITPKPSRTYLSEFINDGNGDITKPFITVDDLSNNTIQSVVGGNNITIDNTDPLNPIISSVASTYPPPYIDVVIPDSTLPSTTGNFELHGSNFKEDMTVAFAGQVVNYKIFHSSLHVTVNVTTGATEGLFSITLNNGISRTFANAYMVVLGTVFSPTSADWTLTEPVNVDNNEVQVQTYNAVGTAKWNKIIDITKKFRITFTFKKSPLGAIPDAGDDIFFNLKNISDSVSKFSILLRAQGYADPKRYYFLNNTYYGFLYENELLDQSFRIRLDYILGVFYAYKNDILVSTLSGVTFTENMNIYFSVKSCDATNIKYIELA